MPEQRPVGPNVLTAPWLVLALLFFVTQAYPIQLQAKRESRSVSLTDAPYVVGLFVLSPVHFLLARLIGGVLAQVTIRRQYREPLKVVFNTVTAAAEAVAGILLFDAVAGHAGQGSPRTWFAAVAAAVFANIISGISVTILIHRIEAERLRLAAVLRMVRSATAHAAPTGSVGLVAALALQVSGWAAVPLLLVCVTLLVG